MIVVTATLLAVILSLSGEADATQCPREGFFAFPGDCTRFYRCVASFDASGFTVFQFACPPGTLFDEAVQVCNHPWAVRQPCRDHEPDNFPAATTTTTRPQTSTSTLVVVSTTSSTGSGVVPPPPNPPQGLPSNDIFETATQGDNTAIIFGQEDDFLFRPQEVINE